MKEYVSRFTPFVFSFSIRTDVTRMKLILSCNRIKYAQLPSLTTVTPNMYYSNSNIRRLNNNAWNNFVRMKEENLGNTAHTKSQLA